MPVASRNTDIIRSVYQGTVIGVVDKFGDLPSMSNTAVKDVWTLGDSATEDQWYTAGGGAISVVSDDAADTGTIYLQWVDSSGVEHTESKALAGLTPVTGWEADAECLYRMRYDSGSLTTRNAGNITATIGGTASAYISAGDGQTEQAFYCVPTTMLPSDGFAGGTVDHAHLVDVYVQPEGTSAVNAKLWVAKPGESWALKYRFRNPGSPVSHTYTSPDSVDLGFRVEAGSLVKLTATRASGASAALTAGFKIIMLAE